MRRPLTRRTFLRALAGLASGAPALLAGCGEEDAEPGIETEPVLLPASNRPRLPERERRVLSRALERILPSGDGPGAQEAGAIDYAARALHEPPWATRREAVLRGAAALDALAARDWDAAGYVEVEDDGADRILEFVQSGLADVDAFDGASFVHDLVVLALEGFLGDPIHGGNFECAGWRYIGYEPGQPRPGHCGH